MKVKVKRKTKTGDYKTYEYDVKALWIGNEVFSKIKQQAKSEGKTMKSFIEETFKHL